MKVFVFFSRYLATGDSFNAVICEYLITASTIRKVVENPYEKIWNIFQRLYKAIKQQDDWILIADEFYRCTNFPNIIRGIDGKAIRMVQAKHSESS